MAKEVSIVWFRQDLRISDNLALRAGCECGEILPIYIFDNCEPEQFRIGAASKLWLHHSLIKLSESLGGNLNLYMGKTDDIIKNLLHKYHVKNIFYNKCYEPWGINQEIEINNLCNAQSVLCKGFNSNYLWAPSDILKGDGSYYKVFTAYKNKTRSVYVRDPVAAPRNITAIKDSTISIADLDLIPKNQWYEKIQSLWKVGEAEAQNKLNDFVETGLAGYRESRDYCAKSQTSKLSPHLHFGEISPCQIWSAVQSFGTFIANHYDIEHFLNELIWREFSCYLLYHFNTLHSDNFNSKFNKFPWASNAEYLDAWRKGETGYPLVDAGMRELWQTGYMHNRVRMVVGSFLVKNLNLHWHHGRDWFWDCLLDADLANNSNNWQWVAGCGIDAAPYFRIFNPTTQGEKFDVDGEYTRKFVPELKNLPNKYLFKPWLAPESVLKSAGVTLGKTYKMPIVDLKSSREKALVAYKGVL